MEECRKQLHVAQAVLTLDAFENQVAVEAGGGQ